MQETAISTNHLTKTFSGKEILKNCNISVKKGTIYGLLGKNGAGKTTLFKLLLGLLKPTVGTASVLGRDSVKNRIQILRHTGSLIGTPVFYEHLSAADNLRLHLAYMGLDDTEAEPALDRVDLSGTGPQPVREFSLGMRERLAIARSIVHRPEILILDEPTNGLDPAGIREIRFLFRQLAEESGMTILLSSHFLSEILQNTDRIGVLAEGRIALEEDTARICARHPNDLEDYLITVMEAATSYEPQNDHYKRRNSQ